MSFRWRLLALFVLALGGAGCRASAPDVPVLTAADEAGRWAMLSVRVAPMRDAWTVLRTQPYTRVARTEQHAEDGALRAFAERVVALTPSQGLRLVTADSAGAFDYGHFQLFTSEILPTRDPVDLGTLVLQLAEGPLRPENALAYRFRQRGDTTLRDTPVQVLEAVARPEAGDGLNVRRLTYYFDPAANDLVGLRLTRVDLGKFFREESEVEVVLHPLPGGTYAPALTRVRTEAIMPFQPRLPVTTVARYHFGAPLLAAR